MKDKIKYLFYRIRLAFLRMRYPESIWYGGSISREHAVKMVGAGWSNFINNLYDAKPKNTRITSVKEKYGTLRYYVSSAPEWYYDLISYYGERSGETCEECGLKGEVRYDLGWYLTLCDEHYEATKNKNKGK